MKLRYDWEIPYTPSVCVCGGYSGWGILGEAEFAYRDVDPDQIFRQHATENKRQYASRVLEVEQATFTPLVFSTIGRMAVECKRYHSRLAALIATKKGRKLYNYHVMDPGKSVNCRAEISLFV